MIEGVCEIWWADLAFTREWHLNVLSGVEQRRRAAVREEADRARFTLGAVVLRLVTSRHTGLLPSEVVIDRSCPSCGRPHGRPQINRGDLHVSVSHSGARVAVAITSAGPVGVDVEEITDVDLESLIPEVFAPEEDRSVSSAVDFYVSWTRKEAVVKATGDGLAVPLRQVVVTPPREAPKLIAYPGRALIATMRDLTPGVGYAAALAVVSTASIAVRQRSALDLLETEPGGVFRIDVDPVYSRQR